VTGAHYAVDMGRDLVSPVLVGRHRELDRLRALIEQAGAGVPAVALVSGEAGVGKSRLVREAVRIATDHGVRVLSGGCVELGGDGIPLAPLIDVLRGLARSTPPEELDRLLGPARREFARLLPELDPAVLTSASQEGSATQLLEHVLGLITRLATQRPLLLVVEDLHWADRSTRDLVVFLVQTLRELDVLLLLTYRSDELHRRHPLRPLITAWDRVRTVERIEVGRFGREEVAAQLQAIRNTTPTPQFADVVFERSQGNAFLVEEIVAAVDGGADPGDLPPLLRDVLLARTERVSDTAQRVLRTASAASPPVGDRLLEAVTGLTEANLYAALREAIEHHLLVVDRGDRGYAFRHELTRDAIYEDMLPGERVRLHATYGEALSSDPTLLGDDGNVAATLAHHWYAALDLPRALSASVQAGRQAAAAYAPADALRHLERALQIWSRVPDAAERAGVDWTQLNLLAADAAWSTGELGHALSIVDQVLVEAYSVTDPVRRAQAIERRALVLRALGRDAEAVGQLEEALALLPPQPLTSTHAIVLASLANSLARIDDMGGAAKAAQHAVTAAVAAANTAAQADALITQGSASAYLGDAPAGLAAMREAITLAEHHDLHDVAVRGYINLSDTLEMLGQHAQAAHTAQAGIALATRIGFARTHGAMLAGNVAEPLIRIGRWREALDLITESLADEPSGPFASSLFLLRGELQLWQGDQPAAEHDVREARRKFGTGSDTQFTAPMAFIEAELARAAGELVTARERICTILDQPVGALGLRYAWPLVWLGMRVEAEIHAEGRADPDAGKRQQALQSLAAAFPATTPPALAYQAMTAAEAARLDQVDEVHAWQAATDAIRAAEEAFPLCYCLFRLAQAQCGQPPDGAGAEDATKTAQECLQLAERLAAATAHDVRALARRARLRIEQPAPAAAPRPDIRFRLTDREHEVLTLVAEGRSNGQIAATLFISPKTASVHVSNILAKLGVATRTEAATTAHRLGLLAPPASSS
jgi:DNA-binding CsgD family transcriptional regulator/tetratricopeptide (TPR) repeat protein